MHALLSFALLLAAPAGDGVCSPSSALGDLATSVEAVAASAVPAPPVRVVFDGEFRERILDSDGGPGIVFEGSRVELVVSPDRFPRCGADNATAFVKDKDGNIRSYFLQGTGNGMLGASFVAPPGGVEVWLHSAHHGYRNIPACDEWDSDFGNNYPIGARAYEPARATFANGAEAPLLDKPLVPGGALVIDYDADRLTTCRNSVMGHPTWSILAHVRYDNGREAVKMVAGTIPTTGGPVSFAIPQDARNAEVWFENIGHYPGSPDAACRAWDSRGGANYSFPIGR